MPLWFIAPFWSLPGQTQGLGTALKILFSGRQIEALPTSSIQRPPFQLSRQEIVSLFNAFGRWFRPSETCWSSLENKLCGAVKRSGVWNKSLGKIAGTLAVSMETLAFKRKCCFLGYPQDFHQHPRAAKLQRAARRGKLRMKMKIDHLLPAASNCL